MKKHIRKAVYSRDENTCVCCDEWLPRGELQLHHILPLRLNGPDQPFNLVVLCHGCHTEWHKHESAMDVMWDPTEAVREFYRWLVRNDDHGDELALEHREDTMAYYDNLLEKLIRQIPHSYMRSHRQPKNLRRVKRPNKPQ